ncbi:phosphatidate cytidylyltransferase [Paracandidimonas lactea]|uniref:phosphatidate cytidylyltransferase n=1 Tax=Paracandidimonas lactea TaxID=2895524 RepID=UPI001F21F7F4|nr:phosphatidate cytidylyltransferase [Paracandidimonas lactea]
MLRQRVITAVILLIILLAALLASSPLPLVLLLALIAACALWEWLRLTSPIPGPVLPAAVALAIGLGLAVVALQWLSVPAAPWTWSFFLMINQWLLPAVALAWLAGGSAMVVRARTDQRRHPLSLSLFAVLAALSAWAALVQLFRVYGAWYLVSLLATIWIADIAAYFVGKAWGRNKLAPRVSPGKTIEGALGGIVGATAWVIATSFWPGSFGAVLAGRWPLWAVVLIAIFLAALSIVGDLFESLLKRRAGVKDSSNLLPGHGGVYDRIDALLPVAPFAFLFSTGLW